jgi:hypothetical protein
MLFEYQKLTPYLTQRQREKQTNKKQNRIYTHSIKEKKQQLYGKTYIVQIQKEELHYTVVNRTVFCSHS